MEENNIIETTLESEVENMDNTSTSPEIFEEDILVKLVDGKDATVSIKYEMSDTVVQKVINDSDALVDLFMQFKTADNENYNSTMKTAYNSALQYLISFNIDTMDYLELYERDRIAENIIIDAIAISRTVRNSIIAKAQSK